MKNIFRNRYNNQNPFNRGSKKKGDDAETMADDNNEEIIEEQTEAPAEDAASMQAEEAPGEAAEGAGENLKEEPAEKSETEKLQEKYEILNSQYIRLAADFDNYRKRMLKEKQDFRLEIKKIRINGQDVEFDERFKLFMLCKSENFRVCMSGVFSEDKSGTL